METAPVRPRDHVDTRIGAYGGDAWDRRDLPNHAFARAERHLGRRFHGSQTVVRRGVEAAHAVGARAVAVATGTTSAARLAAAGADVVLPDLTDTSAVLHAITAPDPAALGGGAGTAHSGGVGRLDVAGPPGRRALRGDVRALTDRRWRGPRR
ncbi:HAD hydrolase-like protein [Micromonospora sp. NPDC023633]|uniref:HAD hydrolase-like protein n=1 Tax=Micromonospora sp. NPDC023633 TaxID=3154320 RepID=UPI0033DFADDD